MGDFKKLKQNAKKALFRNYLHCIFVCLIMTIIVGNYMVTIESFVPIQHKEDSIQNSAVNNTEELLMKLFGTTNVDNIDLNKEKKVNDGTFGLIFKALTVIQKHTFNFINSLSTFINNDIIGGIITLILSIGTLIIKFFIANPLKVGEARFFMENRSYEKTSFKRIFYSFKKERYLKIVKTMFLADLYQMLWFFTIIGGVIKFYSYRMVPYILAENANITSKDAITLSRNLMKGNKFKTFILDLSFIGWTILQFITWGVAGYLFANPYYRATDTELYTKLKKRYIETKKEAIQILNDDKLDNPDNLESYPGTKIRKDIKVKNDKYFKTYKITSYILFFFIFSFVGYIYEVTLFFFREGMFINRGTLIGPWLPIYGTGCLIMLLLLIPKENKKITDNPILTFTIITIICTVLEYVTAWYLETFLHAKWWDYSGMFMNIQGRVCLECSILFGLGGCACIYLVAPWIEKKLEKIPEKIKITLCIILIVLFSIDYIYSSEHPHMGKGITTSKLEKCYVQENNS